MIYEFIHNGETKTVELKDGNKAVFADSQNTIDINYTPDGRIFIQNAGASKEIFAVTSGNKTFVDIDGTLFEFTIPSEENGIGGAGGELTDPSKVFAPMPGKVVKVMVKVGDEVEKKDQLIIVEAMKMEHICIARAKAKVSAVNFSIGDQVDTDTPLIELELVE
ncbi:MAG: biotin/lipoyl-containing protein [candidate division Zixibacteria bacterium]